MPATVIDVKYVAHLARVTLTPAEEEQFSEQLGQILKHLEKLNQLDVNDVDPTAHAMPLVNVFRADQTTPCLPHEEAMGNAPRAANGLFIVPKIVE